MMQYVGKAEIALVVRLSNHRKDTKNPNGILACRHFQQVHSFNNPTKFIIGGNLVNTSSSKDISRERLIKRKNLRIQKLKNLVPYGLYQELSK